MAIPVYVSGAVEGPTDERALRRVVESRGGLVHRVQVQEGKANLRRALPGYNNAARRSPWLVLVDLDQSFPCAAALVSSWLPAPASQMRLRVVVHQLEAWLLADHERFASWFGVSKARVPADPDELDDAKQSLLLLIGRSRKTAVRADMLPREGSGRRVGPAYTSRIMEFIGHADQGWRPESAARRSPSLAKCIVRLDELLRGG